MGFHVRFGDGRPKDAETWKDLERQRCISHSSGLKFHVALEGSVRNMLGCQNDGTSGGALYIRSRTLAKATGAKSHAHTLGCIGFWGVTAELIPAAMGMALIILE